MNVIDKYKEWQVDLIKEEVQKNAFPYAALMENWGSDYNLSTLIRNANAFGAKEVFYLKEKKKWDARGAVGTHHYSNAASTLANYEWKADTLLVFGEEGNGLSKQMLAMCEDIVYIPQYGSVRSLNVGTTSGIIMNDLVSKTIYNVGFNNGRNTKRGTRRPQTQTAF